MSTYLRDINLFMVACDALLSIDLEQIELAPTERKIIQFYISALGEKFPAHVN